MSKYGVFCGPYFPVFGLHMEIYEAFSSNTGKYRPEKKPYLNTYYETGETKIAARLLIICIRFFFSEIRNQ